MSSNNTLNYRDAEAALRERASPARVKILSSFFKTGPGQYGEGDQFIGVNIPVAGKIADQFRTLSLPDIRKLLNSPVHEVRVLALMILVRQFERADKAEQKRLTDFYLSQKKRINNWDLVDLTAYKILGVYLLDRDKKILFQFARSPHLWTRRIAIVSTLHFIRCRRFDETLALSEILLGDDHDLMHKACGWMLREVGKRDEKTLVKFLKKNAAKMPRTMLRYAIEKFPEPERKKWLAVSSQIKKKKL